MHNAEPSLLTNSCWNLVKKATTKSRSFRLNVRILAVV
jgi:hypothetical protein